MNMKACNTVVCAGFIIVVLTFGTVSAEQTLTPNQNPDGTLPIGPGVDTGPCEELGNPTLGKDKRITIQVNQRERELVHLAVEG